MIQKNLALSIGPQESCHIWDKQVKLIIYNIQKLCRKNKIIQKKMSQQLQLIFKNFRVKVQ